MKLFFVGGLYADGDRGSPTADTERMSSSMRELGAALAALGHDFVLCSPYVGSIDREIIQGVARSGHRPRIEMHFPETEENVSAVRQLSDNVGVGLQTFMHAASEDSGDQGKRYAWLLSQLSALDTAHVVIAAGGNPSGSANMLLHLAEARRKLVLPFGHLGGAAARCLERQRYVLEDSLGDQKAWLQAPSPMERVSEVLDRLTSPARSGTNSSVEQTTFFISYPRDRAADADLVETMLRRRGRTVFRDDQEFDANGELQQEIDGAIRRSHVFVALWSVEYACSPWCHDEMALALELRAAGNLDIWLLQLDGTRIVPPGARNLISQPCSSREKLQATMLKLLEARERISEKSCSADEGATLLERRS